MADEKHMRLGVCCGLAVPSAPELSPCPRLRVAGLLPLVKGLGISSLGLGESLLRARKPTGEEVDSPWSERVESWLLSFMRHGVVAGVDEEEVAWSSGVDAKAGPVA